MKYLLLIRMGPWITDNLSEEEREAIGNEHQGYIKSLIESGEFVLTQALADPSKSRTVRLVDGAPAVTDGPYVEAKEYLAGYYIVDCESDERANEVASQMPDARYTGIEVRPIMFEGGTEM
jgi:hypothetical protein